MFENLSTDLIGLFIGSFLASTLLPGGSEALLLWIQAQQTYSTWQLLSVATLGNALGGFSSYVIGRWLAVRYKLKIEQKALQRIQRWGAPVLLLSWVPVLGDPLCVAAGYLRLNAWGAVGWILLGKCARYTALLYGAPFFLTG